MIPGRFDHLVPQLLFEPVTVKIRKFTAHPLEEDSADTYLNDGKEYYEVTLTPEDGPYPLPYVARRADGLPNGKPFEAADLNNPALRFGGRQFFYPDASRVFMEIDRTISGRSVDGEGSTLDRKADYDFIRVLPPGGYLKKGEVLGVDFFPYKPYALYRRPRITDLAKVANSIQRSIKTGQYDGAIWLEGSPSIEETLYWISLLIDTDLPIVGTASQRPHGQLSNDGDQNIVNAVDFIISGKGRGLGVVGIQDHQIFAAREFKKADARPGGYKATGGHGGILGSVREAVVTIWYRPSYKHTSLSGVNLTRLPAKVEFFDKVGDSSTTSVQIKDQEGNLRGGAIPRVHIVKGCSYITEDEPPNLHQEVDIISRIGKALDEQSSPDVSRPKLHGFILEGYSPYADTSPSQMKALELAVLNGLPVVRVGRSDPAGRVITNNSDLTIEGSNLDANKARLLLMASMLKLGRLPRAIDPKSPTSHEKETIIQKTSEFQEIFENH